MDLLRDYMDEHDAEDFHQTRRGAVASGTPCAGLREGEIQAVTRKNEERSTMNHDFVVKPSLQFHDEPLPKLPFGWNEHISKSGLKYYTNRLTKVATWSRPYIAPPEAILDQPPGWACVGQLLSTSQQANEQQHEDDPTVGDDSSTSPAKANSTLNCCGQQSVLSEEVVNTQIQPIRSSQGLVTETMEFVGPAPKRRKLDEVSPVSKAPPIVLSTLEKGNDMDGSMRDADADEIEIAFDEILSQPPTPPRQASSLFATLDALKPANLVLLGGTTKEEPRTVKPEPGIQVPQTLNHMTRVTQPEVQLERAHPGGAEQGPTPTSTWRAAHSTAGYNRRSTELVQEIKLDDIDSAYERAKLSGLKLPLSVLNEILQGTDIPDLEFKSTTVRTEKPEGTVLTTHVDLHVGSFVFEANSASLQDAKHKAALQVLMRLYKEAKTYGDLLHLHSLKKVDRRLLDRFKDPKYTLALTGASEHRKNTYRGSASRERRPQLVDDTPAAYVIVDRGKSRGSFTSNAYANLISAINTKTHETSSDSSSEVSHRSRRIKRRSVRD